PIDCPQCGYYDEDMEDGFYNEDLIKEKVEPAESVIGKWGGKRLDVSHPNTEQHSITDQPAICGKKQGMNDTYLWFSNLVHELGIEDEWKIPYYYGTYTCPQCGRKGILMEWMKENQL
ncbi:MAG: hypothetical protein K2L18_10780, partial [Acetatifactor sp.]|nr:hypothetical protein [Acetatifactor sp.]